MDETAAAVVLSEQSVLAEHFVPQHLREVNEWQVTAPFVAASHQLAEAVAGPRGLLVPFVPICYCLGYQQISSSKLFHTFPLPDSNLHNDLYHAVVKRQRTLHLVPSTSEKETLSDQCSSSSGDDQSSHPQQPSQNSLENGLGETASVDNISNLDEYLSTWRELLRMERLEVLHRYENYSQYSQPLNIQSINSNGSRFAQDKQYTPILTEHVATLYVPGIADASPPIAIGDTVLVRPMHLVSLPLMYGAKKGPSQSSHARHTWSPPIHVVEIRATVRTVQRAVTLPLPVSDSVLMSWIQPSEWDKLSHTLNMKQTNGKLNHSHPLSQPTFNVRFVPSTTTHQRCLTALQWLGETYREDPRACMELLFPTTAPVVTLSLGAMAANDILSRSASQQSQQKVQLNDKQASFVSMVLARTHQPSENRIRPPMVLTGCAGTGKTKTMLSAVYGILAAGSSSQNQYRILICTPSHTAADVITRRLGEQLDRDQLFRMYSADRPVATVPVKVLGFCRQANDQTGTFNLPDVSILMKFQVIVCTCSDAHILYRIGLTNQQLRIRRRCFELFLSKTCEGTNLTCSIAGVEEPHFTHLFIDEAAQATEPETLIPLSVVMDIAGCTKRAVEIALVGDPRQLSPDVYSSAAAAGGLDRSLLERLLQRPVTCLGGGREHMLGPDFERMEDWIQYSFQRDGHEQLTVFLTANYRGHPTFLMMPSVLFYSDKLHSANFEKELDAGESFWCEKLRHIENLTDPVLSLTGSSANEPDGMQCRKQFNWPLHLRGVVGKDTSVTVTSGFSSSSWENLAEAQAVLEICVTLHKEGVSSKSIGVMASFRGQVVLIRKLLRSKNLSGINVGTIEDYQSVEHDVIVLSLVRGTQRFVEHDIKNRMGVFGQSKRANVALTRAEFLFIVVGNPVVMSNDAVWLQFMLFCHRNGLFYGDAPDDTSVLNWNETKSMVRYPPKLPTASRSVMQIDSHEPEVPVHIVTVGTLERALRH